MYKFLGIGAQKAGTTWLYEMLNQHPDISFPLGKEAHYWDKQYPKRTPAEYLSNFNSSTWVEGEITPAYAFLPLDIITVIYNLYPHLNLFFIIRNPIERAWSSAKMALGRAEMELNEASDQWFIDHFNSKGSLIRGDYESNLRNWTSIFNKKQLQVILFDDIKNKPRSILLECCKHLEINKFTDKQLESMPITNPVFSTPNELLRPSLRYHLESIYKNKIQSLESYLDIDLSHWLTT